MKYKKETKKIQILDERKLNSIEAIVLKTIKPQIFLKKDCILLMKPFSKK